MKNFLFILTLISSVISVVPAASFADDSALSLVEINEQKQKEHDDILKAKTNIQAWIQAAHEENNTEEKTASDKPKIGNVYIEHPASNDDPKLFSATLPGNLDVFDVIPDTAIPGVVYLSTGSDHMPHLIVYFHDSASSPSRGQQFKDLLTSNPNFQLQTQDVIPDDAQDPNTIEIAAKDLKFKKANESVAVQLNTLLCPLVEPGLMKKASAWMTGAKAEPEHTNCL